MNDKIIITQNEKNYIETLYLYINLENVSTATELEQSNNYKYYNVLSYMSDNMFINAKCLGEAKGRTWYKFDNYRLGIMDYDKAKIANQFNCLIQYEQKHLWTLDKELSKLDLPFDVDRKYYHIKRIDITKIAKHDEDYLTNFDFISPYRRNDRVNGTVYLGNRSNGNVFRMYNKTVELLTDTKEHPIDYKKIALLSKYFGSIENLWTYELELTRTFLKNELGIQTLSELSKVYAANKNIVGKIRFYENNDKNKKLIKQDNAKRIKGFVLTDYEEFERVEKKAYKPSYAYHIEALKKEINRYLSTGLEENELNYYIKMFTELTQELDINKKELTFSLEDSDLQVENRQMTAKYELLRDNQGNDLEVEAKRHFCNFDSHKNAVAEIKV